MMKRKSSGVTLLELMIVVAVIGILTAVAIPSYTNYVQRGRRVEAQTRMLEVQQFMQRYYSARNTYVGAQLPSTLTRTPEEGQGPVAYNISLQNLTAGDYTIRAVPAGAMASDECGTLTLNSVGQRGSTGSTVAKCWR